MTRFATTRFLLPAALLLALSSAPALAQGVAVATQAQATQLNKRVTTLEGQMRAVQRQVFPGGDKRFFAPEITPETEASPDGEGTSPLVDLTQRVTALEMQQRDLTGTVEQLQFRLRQLEESLTKLRGDTEYRLNALEGGPTAEDGETAAAAGKDADNKDAGNKGADKTADAAQVQSAPEAKPAATDPAATGPEAAEAEYRAGYDLYTKGEFAEAEQRLEAFVAAHANHPRASNAQFWAGRSMLAQGRTAEAAKAFLAGYQKFPKGQRAHNSLLYLGKSLLDMKQPKAACQALDQLKSGYADRLTGAFASDVTKTRQAAGCGA